MFCVFPPHGQLTFTGAIVVVVAGPGNRVFGVVRVQDQEVGAVVDSNVRDVEGGHGGIGIGEGDHTVHGRVQESPLGLQNDHGVVHARVHLVGLNVHLSRHTLGLTLEEVGVPVDLVPSAQVLRECV